MKKEKILIGDKTYTVEVVDDEPGFTDGLSGREKLGKDEGMLFDFTENPGEKSFWMKDTIIPLDIIFLDEDGIVKKVYHAEPENKTLYTEDDVYYVLEVNQNSDITKGDQMSFYSDKKLKVLGENGEVQTELFGGERVFSRKNTRILVKKAKKAGETNSDSDYKALGKILFKYIDIQDNNETEYVDNPNAVAI